MALQEAFPDQDALATFLFEYMEARYGLAQLGGSYTALHVLARRLIETASARDDEHLLVARARAANATNALLVRVAHELAIAPSSAPESGFEVLINPANPFADVAVLLARLGEIEGRVGRVEYEAQGRTTGVATAFLVAADLVLTNHHVFERLRENGIDPGSCRVRFDCKVLPDGKQLNPGRAVPFASSGWLVDSSPPSPLDGAPVPGSDPDPGHLDYALVRLEEPIGELPMGPDSVGEGPRRGWITAPPTPVVTPNTPLWIMQHPSGDPLKLAFAERGVEGVNANGTRMRHRVNTEPGSSGSPCFGPDLLLIGLHHYGERHSAPWYNQAIPIAAVRDRLHANRHTTALV
jgi:hypothetical protein